MTSIIRERENNLKPEKISDMLNIIRGSIVDKENWENHSIDTIVNAAKPTLMGSTQGVDGAIHHAVEQLKGEEGVLRKHICHQFEVPENNNRILCKRGQAVTTEGCDLCNWIIHAVGIPYDGVRDEFGRSALSKECSSSCVNTLESCYYEIVNEIKNHLDMEVIGIPIIGSGEYGFPFKLAVQIAIASIGNALIEWKKQDLELFEMSKLRKINFYIYNPNEEICNKELEIARGILEGYNKYFKEDKKVVFQKSYQAHVRYLKEIIKYDTRRGYFAVAKTFRLLLLMIRTFFLPSSCIKDIWGKEDWGKRRQIVEVITMLKIFLPILCWWVYRESLTEESTNSLKIVLSVFVIYSMVDTVTYLLTLIILADIQRPSANVVRSIILLFVNYIEISCNLAFLYYVYYKSKDSLFTFRKALAYGVVGESGIDQYKTLMDYLFLFLGTGLKFFFVTMVMGYFFSHMRQRKFRS